jgi:thioredoxin 1
MAQTNVTSATWQKEVLEHDKPVLVDFWAVWCGPCQMVNPTLEKISESYKDKLKVVKLNVDENQDIASANGVMSIPTFIIFHAGKKLGSFVGAMPEEMFIEHVDEILAKVK